MHVVLVNPQIAPNTGNIIRLCANTGAHLHLVEPLGYSLDDKLLKRGGLDYHELADVKVHTDFDAAMSALAGRRMFTFSSKSTQRYDEVEFTDDDVLIFGAERTGLPSSITNNMPSANRLKIPMRPGNRSLNLANSVSLVLYEAWRQLGFAGADLNTGASISETPGADSFDS